MLFENRKYFYFQMSSEDPKSKTNLIENLSFEDAIGKLEQLVDRLEKGKVNLEEAMELYAKGNELRKYCEKKLAEAQLKIEKIEINKNNASI